MSNSLGNKLRVTIFGQSHAPSIGCVIEGIPAGQTLDMERIQAFMARRAPGNSRMATARKESDLPEILSGFNEFGQTCGAPLAMRIVNGDHHSKDYTKLRDIPRPGHADYTAAMRYQDANDIRGGGQFSGRLTAPLCFAGAIAMQLLEQKGVHVRAHAFSIAGVSDDPIDAVHPNLDAISGEILPVVNPEKGRLMESAILDAKNDGDSVGGVIECIATGMPAGLGDPMFDGMENRLAQAFFGIPAVRGVEFGMGFAACALRGSAHNDAFRMENDTVVTETNRHGGILGGITSGMPIIARIGIKPTPSIAREQKSVSLSQRKDTELIIQGRHDPCIVPRAIPCVEAAMAIVLLDSIL